MNCQRVLRLISAYVDGELPGIEMLTMRQHLSDCRDCRSEYESMLLIKRSLGRLSPKHPSVTLAARICAQLDQSPASAQVSIIATIRDRFSGWNGNLRMVTATAAVAVSLLTLGRSVVVTNNQQFDSSSLSLVRSIQENDPVHYFSLPINRHPRTTEMASDLRLGVDLDLADTGSARDYGNNNSGFLFASY